MAAPETLEPPDIDEIHFEPSGKRLYESPSHANYEVWSKGEGYIDRSYDPAQILRVDRPWESGVMGCWAKKEYGGQTTEDWCMNYLIKDNSAFFHVFTKFIGTDVDDKMIGATYNSGHLSGWRQNEIFVAGKGNDIVRGEHGNDHIFGGLGNDRLHGDSGDDTIVGNEAGDDSPDMDIIFSGSGSDTVYAQAGDDWIYTDNLEHNNLDWLSGGTGSDTFVISQPFGPDMGSTGWTLNAMDLLVGFGNDMIDLYFTSFLPSRKIGKEIAPMSLDIVKWILAGSPQQTRDPPHQGRCTIADFNPLQDRILVQLDPHRMSPNVSIKPANNGENAWVLTSDGFDLCYVNWAPADEIFGDDVNYIGSTPSDILIKMLQQNAKVVGGGKFALGIELHPNWYDDLVDPPETLDDTENGSFLMIGNWGGYVTIGSADHDHLIGNDHPNGDALYAYALDIKGGDVIAVKDGDDILRGYGGPDLLAGGSGFNQLYGGEDRDTVSFAHARTGIVADMKRTGEWHGDTFFVAWNGYNLVDEYDPNEDVSLTGRDGYDWVFDVENIIGSRYNDEIHGNDQKNYIYGGSGYNTVSGRGGDDTFFMTDEGTTKILDYNPGEGDNISMDRESYDMNLMDPTYNLHDLVYYHQDGDLYFEVKSSSQTIAILPDTTMSQDIWHRFRVENDLDTNRFCIEDRDGTFGHCRHVHNNSSGKSCKGDWMCNQDEYHECNQGKCWAGCRPYGAPCDYYGQEYNGGCCYPYYCNDHWWEGYICHEWF
eukprot:Clim_evm5s38 gene=Clim_evmTU5s38